MKRLILLVAVLAIFLAGNASLALATKPGDDGEHKVLLCHRTASDTNPYVLIEVDVASLPAHLNNLPGHPAKTNADGSPRNDYLYTKETPCATSEPSSEPTPEPSSSPSEQPSEQPTQTPTPEPTSTPIDEPSATPSPTETPSSPTPTSHPSVTPPPTDTADATTVGDEVNTVWVILAAIGALAALEIILEYRRTR